MNMIKALFFALLAEQSAHAYTIECKDQTASVAKDKKIIVSITLADNEIGIYKHGLYAIVHHNKVNVKAIKPSIQPTIQHDAVFKRTKKIYVGSFNLTIILEHKDQDDAHFLTHLSQAHLCIAGFILQKNGKVKPFCKTMSFPAIKNTIVSTHQDEKNPDATPSEDRNGWFVAKPSIPVSIVDTRIEHEFIISRQLFKKWSLLTAWIENTLYDRNIYMMLLLSIIFILLVMLAIKIRFKAFTLRPWERDFVMLGVFIASFLLIALQTHWHQQKLYYVASGWCALLSFYLLLSAPDKEYFLGRLKNLAGIIVGSCVLPLAIKAFLISKGL